MGRRTAGRRLKPQVDPSADQRIQNGQDESGGLRDAAEDRPRHLPSEGSAQVHGSQSAGPWPVLHGPGRSGTHQAGLRGGSQKGHGGEGNTGGWDFWPQYPDWSSHGGSSCTWSLRGRCESPGKMEE